MVNNKESNTVEFKTIPTLVICRAPISKIKYEYLSFLNADGSGYLKNHLEERMRPRKKETKQNGKTVKVEVPGENLTHDSPIIIPKQLNVGSHIRTTNISEAPRDPSKKGVFADQDAEIGHYVFFMASLIFEARVMASALWACMA